MTPRAATLSLLCLFMTTLFCTLLIPAAAGEENAAARYYLGSQACRSCHNNPAAGNQYTIWRLSGHAKSYAMLASADADLITRLSGLRENPHKTPVCLGCHTTASDTEAWQRNPLFDQAQGIQCEYCHGPGSEYASWDIMADKAAAKKAGLMMPDEAFCRDCHLHKGSHRAKLVEGTVVFQHPVKDEVYFDYPSALKRIRHSGTEKNAAKPAPEPRDTNASDQYLGLPSCALCHGEADSSHITSSWRMTRHADSFAELTTEQAMAIARKNNIAGNPQHADECLRCHSTAYLVKSTAGMAQHADMADGVQCESCHGPGKLYTDPKNMQTPHPAVAKIDKKTCQRCHNGYHGATFDFDSAVALVDHRRNTSDLAGIFDTSYKTPFNLLLNKAATKLFITCEASNSLVIVDTKKRQVIEEIAVMQLPHGLALSPDERMIYVSNRGSDTISVIDASNYKVVQTIVVGDEPHGLVTNGDGSILVVANTGSHDISIIDLKKGIEIKRLAGGRGTWALTRSPDMQSIVATNNLSHFVPFRTSSLSELTVIDTASMTVKNRAMVPDANLIQGIDYSPDGTFAMFTLLRTKNLVPIVRVLQGWMITNGFGILWPDGSVDQLLIDGVDNYFADPTDLVITPDGKYAYITGGGVNEVAVIDIEKAKQLLNDSAPQVRKDVLPNHLGASEGYVAGRIPVGNGPRGLATDGTLVYVADALDDAVSVIDIATQKKVGAIDLGGPRLITQIRRGERIFHSADVTYGRQYSCHSCHPDGGIDGLAYDISADGLGFNPVDNRTLRGVLDTAPFKWSGTNPSLNRQCGPRLAVFFTRSDPFTAEQARDLESYIVTIPRNPNRYLKNGELTAAQQRGKKMFYRTHTNDGREIPTTQRCNSCHGTSYYTNRQIADVGTASQWDTSAKFDAPHLNNIYETAPYLHDGRALTLEEIWTVYNPNDQHGITNDMTKDQLNDLIEYLRIL